MISSLISPIIPSRNGHHRNHGKPNRMERKEEGIASTLLVPSSVPSEGGKKREGQRRKAELFHSHTLIYSSNSCRFPWTFFDHSNLLELFSIVKLKRLFTDDHAYDPGCTGSELLGMVYLYHVNDRRFCVSVFLFLVGLSES